MISSSIEPSTRSYGCKIQIKLVKSELCSNVLSNYFAVRIWLELLLFFNNIICIIQGMHAYCTAASAFIDSSLNGAISEACWWHFQFYLQCKLNWSS